MHCFAILLGRIIAETALGNFFRQFNNVLAI